MAAIFGLFMMLFWLLISVAVVVAIIAFFGYNKLRAHAEAVREAMSNIGVTSKKQASLINQLIDVVKGYQDSEKFVMLKISDDVNAAAQAAMVYQQSNVVLSAASGLAQRFPELKSNQQYARLIDSIQGCESQLEAARQKYNAAVKAYNVRRSSVPAVFYASTLGFKPAPYLEFTGGDEASDIGTVHGFASDDGERLNMLLGQAGSSMVRLGGKALEGSRALAGSAHERIRHLAHDVAGADAATDAPVVAEPEGQHVAPAATCAHCGHATGASDVFCAGCGQALRAV
ncbi:LemA family protein [mine drainage metagenome]|jgi:LemA protein|uniref:LemA family protein n=1 Tax=mine drainage metagenome TaxID=410659 RepID=A0A1J5R407_9ZZZZ